MAISLGDKNTLKVIMKLAIPSMIAQFVNILYSIVDRIFVANMPVNGSLALIGVGVCAPIATLLSSFAFLVGLGGAPLFSIALGEKDEAKAKKILNNALLLLVILSTLLMVITYIVLDPMLMAFGASSASFSYAKDYMVIYLLGTYFSLISSGLNQYLTAQGESLAAMLTTLVACLLNIVLDPLFIFTFNMGIKGAALATISCQFISFLWVLIYLIFKSKIKLGIGGYDIKTMLKILKLGFSPFIIMSTDSLIIIALNASLQMFGGEKGDFYITVATIVQAFYSLVTGPLLGISSGTQPILGYHFGAKNKELLLKAQKQIVLFGIIFCAACFLLSFVLRGPFASLFVKFSSDSTYSKEEIINVSKKFIGYYMIGAIPLALQYVFVDGLTGMGQAHYAIWLSLNRKLFVFLPLIFIIPLISKNDELTFLAQPIADTCGGVVSTIAYILIIPKVLKKRMGDHQEDTKEIENLELNNQNQIIENIEENNEIKNIERVENIKENSQIQNQEVIENIEENPQNPSN